MRIKRRGAGGAVAKVQCQGCGGHKLLGHLCDAPAPDKTRLMEFRPAKPEPGLCSWPQVQVRACGDGQILVFLPLCPSNNAMSRAIPMGRRSARTVMTPEARDYKESVAAQLAPILSNAIKLWGWKPRTTWDVVWYWLILPRTSCDPSNYEKVSLDALEKAGAFFDDRYAITRLGGIWFDSKNPGMVFKL